MHPRITFAAGPLFLLLLLTVPTAGVAQVEVEFSGRTWVVRGQEPKVETYLGKEALHLRNAMAFLSDVDFENGTIEFDVATSGHRSFIGVVFRAEEATQGLENFYLRPHNSGRFDALQYTPVDHGQAAWQLYPEHNAGFEIPADRWIHVKLVVSGSRLEVTLDRAGEPIMVIEQLRRGRSRGQVALRSIFPAAGTDERYPTAFADFELHLDEEPGIYIDEAPPPAESGLISQWAVSKPFPAPEEPIEELPAEWLAGDGWQTAAGDATGRVNLARYGGAPEGAARATVLARVVLRSDRERTVKLNFGFSDQASIFLNRRIAFLGDNSYRSRSQRYLGVMTVDHEALFLPLHKGDNELIFAVTEAFGGWGLIARLDRDGVTVEAKAPDRPR